MTIASAVLMLLLVMDPVGNAVNFIPLLKGFDGRKRRNILFRESCAAIAILFIFLFGGKYFLAILNIEEPVLTIAGGVVLFLIAIRMIFSPKEGIFGMGIEGEPFIVPLATPMLAGPSAISVVLLMGSGDPQRLGEWSFALGIVWVIIICVLMLGSLIGRVIGEKGAAAVGKLMGMILTAISIQLLFSGTENYLMLRK